MEEPSGPAHVHEPRLHVALVPTRPLANPVDTVHICFFERDRVEHSGAVPLARDAHPEIGVLGDVERIPRTELDEHVLAEVIRRPAQRNRRLADHQSRQQVAEPDAVVGGEPLRENVVGDVVEAQLALHADDGIVVEFTKRRHHSAQLERVWVILRVEDGDDIACGEMQPVVAGFRFGPRIARRCEHRGDDGRRVDRMGGLDRRCVVLLEQEQYLQLLLRVFERFHRLDQLPDDLRLTVCGNQHGVLRQVVVGDRARLFVGDPDRTVDQAEPKCVEPLDERDDVDHRRDRHQRRRGTDRPEHESDDDDGDHDGTDDLLRPTERDRRGHHRIFATQPVDRVVERCSAVLLVRKQFVHFFFGGRRGECRLLRSGFGHG